MTTLTSLDRLSILPLANASDEPIAFWPAVVRKGVLAVGFVPFGYGSDAEIIAELCAPQSGWVRRAAHAAIEVHKLIAAEPGTPAFEARRALGARIGLDPAVEELATYQALLVERLWTEIEACPAERLGALAYPHED